MTTEERRKKEYELRIEKNLPYTVIARMMKVCTATVKYDLEKHEHIKRRKERQVLTKKRTDCKLNLDLSFKK